MNLPSTENKHIEIYYKLAYFKLANLSITVASKILIVWKPFN